MDEGDISVRATDAAPRERAAPKGDGRAAKAVSGGERLGRIVSVSGSAAMVQLDRPPGGQSDGKPQIGELVRIDTDVGVAYAIISALRAPSPAPANDPCELWVAEAELMGEAPRDARGVLGGFRRGLSRYPTLGATVTAVTHEDLRRAYSLSKDEASVTIGALHQDPTIPVTIKVDEMLGKHFAILGTTGSGKSCSVALLLRTILEDFPHAHAILLDAHGEYASAFQGLAEIITYRDLRLPFWVLTHDEFSKVLLGDREDYAAEAELLGDLVRQAKAIFAAGPVAGEETPKRFRRASDIAAYSADTPAPYRIADLLRVIDDRMGSLEHQSAVVTHRRLRGRLDARIRDHRYEFMFGADAAEIPLADVLSRLFRLPVNGKPLAILELSGLPSEVLSVIVSVTSRLAFDFAIRGDGGVAITLICEEAHNYIPSDTRQGFDPARRAIARIAKEGRKYGVSLGIITQRPSELDPTILSQCNTVFSLRLSNELDQTLVRAAVSDAAAGLMRFLPSLATGEAIAFGDGVALPMRLRFARLAADRRPGGREPRFSESWSGDGFGRDYAERVVERWREAKPDERRTLPAPTPRGPRPPGEGKRLARRWGEKERS